MPQSLVGRTLPAEAPEQALTLTSALLVWLFLLHGILAQAAGQSQSLQLLLQCKLHPLCPVAKSAGTSCPHSHITFACYVMSRPSTFAKEKKNPCFCSLLNSWCWKSTGHMEPLGEGFLSGEARPEHQISVIMSSQNVTEATSGACRTECSAVSEHRA